MSATETTYKTSLINNRRYLGNKYKLQYKTKIVKTLYVVKWNSDHQTIITSGWQINAIRHSEKKWYNGESQMRVLRKVTDEDFEKMEVIL